MHRKVSLFLLQAILIIVYVTLIIPLGIVFKAITLFKPSSTKSYFREHIRHYAKKDLQDMW